MIDLATYRKMHLTHTDRQNDELGPEKMERDEPPDETFLLLLPTTIYGFDLREKSWVDLAVDRIRPVEWNKQAFESLVIEPRTKELIQALVTVHADAKRGIRNASADLISGKGNGLIMLLHGGPGTGKTLTAGSVAELSEKPLYRVTCGDIGTTAENVEKYLKSILFLGKTWDCVVLLDEADVFLEERTLADLQRNALVSVFLRMLEYYEGILILTSNRVGTFDEAFKSRIQLAIHYPSLGSEQRKKIWQNFFKALSRDDIRANFRGLENHLDELATYNMNGRQIRNAITTATQLAKYRKQTLEFDHLKQVLQTSNDFEQYLLLTHGHTDEQFAKDEGIRYS
ncbi:P-loop containing nucleoside triphosphate hydrolase protein [Wilcoxina mikolae CBS 423.85]|nr:P-loop containing nucleoside triphosphate hydrolase protein [Wilcoxina mikolae CBS 423.85]